MICYGVLDPLCPFDRQSTTTYIHMPYMYTGIRGTGLDSATTSSLVGGGSGSAPIGIIIGGSVGAVALIGLAGVAFYCTQKKKPATASVQLTVIAGSSTTVEPSATPTDKV